MRAEVAHARAGPEPAREDVQKCGLAAAVIAEDEHLFALFDEHIQVLEHRMPVEALGKALCDGGVVAPALLGGEGEMDGGRIALRLHQRFLQPVGGLLLMEGGDEIMLLAPAALLLHHALYALDLLHRAQIPAQLQLTRGASQLHMAGVIAPALVDALILHLDGAVGDLVEEVSVVRNDYERAAVGGKELLQPFYRANVQMVGRLVEQQQVRPAQQHLGELCLVALAPAEGAYRPAELLLRKA